MARAVFNGTVLAESDDTVVVEGNHYFPRESLNEEYFLGSDLTTRCAWKGQAQYLSIEVDGEVRKDVAWYYSDPSAAARKIRGRVAFWKGVVVEVEQPEGRRWLRR